MLNKKKFAKAKEPAKDGNNTFLTFEATTHAESGCGRDCDGDHVRVGVHGCRPNLDDIPYEKWTTAEVLATSAAEYIAGKITITITASKGMMQ